MMMGKTTKILSAAATATICLSSTSSAVTPFISRSNVAPGGGAVGWVSSSRHRDMSHDLLSLRGGSTDVPAKSSSSKKKKKKKNKTLAKKDSKKKTSAAAVVAAEEPAHQHEDLSTAIMTKSAGKNSMQVYLYGDTDNHSLCALPSETMSSLNLFDGDTISIRGKRGKKTLGTCTSVDSTGAAGIGLSPDAMKNAGVRSGDDVTVTPHPDLKFGKAVLILPYGDSFSAEDAPDVDLFDDYLRPYFEGKFRTLYRGDTFHISGPAGIVEFKCVEIDTVETDGDSGCVVVDDTLIECDGDALDRDDDVDDLADAGYDTIGGATKHLAAVRELVELPLRHPELWRKLGINPPRGVLLTGPSGCGKTVMARAVAAETGAYFFVINGPEVISKRAGESETNLRRAFEDAEQNSADYNGAIVFIDEIDSIAPRREKAGGEVEKRIVSQLLTLMDGLKPSSKVIVIAATNRPSVIEPALRRPGRFDRELDMGVPDVEGRLEILQIKTRDMRLGNDVDLEQLAKGTHGYVGADLQQLCMEAALECIRSKMGLIDFDKNKVDKAILDSIVVEGKHFDHALGIVHPSSLRENQVEVPDVHWGDVGGLEEVKRELHETVQYPVEHADKYVKFGMSPSKGVLFYGPPGCGKTLLAKAIANECGANFISIKGPELLTQWFGESEANVRELFDKARAASPCILMFDEMDSIAKARGSGGAGSSEAGDRVINQILTEIDGVGARKNVFVIGATNRPDILDPAVIRPGRLDQLIYIPLPDLASREAIFKAALRKAPLDPDVDLNVLARSTLGFSGADITEVCQSASKLAIREAILEEEERLEKVRDGELEDDEGVKTDEDFVITKRHFNFAMSRARKSVSEKDLVLFEEFAEKQKAGRGDAATNFKFEDGGEGGDGADEGGDDDLDLYG
jgi:transitional endoplasmic reticulum ATPase